MDASYLPSSKGQLNNNVDEFPIHSNTASLGDWTNNAEDKNQAFYHLSILEQLIESKADGWLKVTSDSVNWIIYVKQGKLIYATHSIEPFDRLERHLRSLSRQVSSLTAPVRTQARLNFEIEHNINSELLPDYRAICWLVQQKYIDPVATAKLVRNLTKEVLETYLLLQEGTYQFISDTYQLSLVCHLDYQPLIEECQKRLKAWQGFSPKICSPDQRPYLFSVASAQSKISPEVYQKLSKILKGFSFRQLAVLLNQDELILVRNLYPLIANKTIVLRDPEPPFDRLPKISSRSRETIADKTDDLSIKVQTDSALYGLSSNQVLQQKSKIVCVDDSPSILTEINRFLEDHDLSVFTISNPVKALMEIARIQPDVILLDVGMPTIDGYKLCRMLRNHHLFRETPIVMVTGNKGLIDRARARVAGATDYMTKPFTQSELTKMVFRHLT